MRDGRSASTGTFMMPGDPLSVEHVSLSEEPCARLRCVRASVQAHSRFRHSGNVGRHYVGAKIKLPFSRRGAKDAKKPYREGKISFGGSIIPFSVENGTITARLPCTECTVRERTPAPSEPYTKRSGVYG